MPLPHRQMQFLLVADSRLDLDCLKRCGLFRRWPCRNTCPGQREGDRRERQATQTQQSLLSVQEDGVLLFVFPMTSLALLFACFMFPGICSDGLHPAALFSPSMTVLLPLTCAPGLGLCRSIAVACLLQRSNQREKRSQQHPQRCHQAARGQ